MLDTPRDPPGASPLRRHRDGLVLAGLAAVAVAFAAAGRLGWSELAALRPIGVAVGHGALLAASLARVDPLWCRHAARLAFLLLLAAATAQWTHWGALFYLSVPLVLARLARGAPARALRLVRPDVEGWLGAGALAGIALAAHLLLSASLTLGYRARLGAPGPYLAAIAYDIGANVLSAECFFRGTLFDRLQRVWPFGAAAMLATVAALCRYLVDPALPQAVETLAGAALYVALLSVVSCALLARSGSLLPGALAGVGFFAAYRALS